MASREEIKHRLQQYRSQLVGEDSTEAEEGESVEADSHRQYRQIGAVLRAALSQPRTSPSAATRGGRIPLSRAQGIIYRATAWYVEHRVAEQHELYELLTEAMEVMDRDLKSLHAQVSILQNQLAQLQPAGAEESSFPDSSAQLDGGRE